MKRTEIKLWGHKQLPMFVLILCPGVCSPQIWTLEALECVQVLECPGGSVYSLCVTNYHIICGTYENKINVWDIETLEPAGELTGEGRGLSSFCLRCVGEETLLFQVI